MATRLVHLSDLHFPAASSNQVQALIRAVTESEPDLIVVTGDLTRSGRRHEFRYAYEFIERLPVRKMILPGNHDVPVINIFHRLYSPFKRFAHHFPLQDPPFLETEDVIVVGLNTAVSIRATLNWSLGRASLARIASAKRLLQQNNALRLRVVAAHHPLLRDELDEKRSLTSHGIDAFQSLAQAGMDIFLHGHMHRASLTTKDVAGRTVWSIGASTALSDRERGGGSGFNILDVADGKTMLTQMNWQGDRYATSSEGILCPV